MASTKQVFSFIVASFLVFLLPPSHAASHSDFEDIKISSSIDSQMVNLSVYYEALSPSCATFIIQNLTGVFDDDLITITNLRMVPWGNAHVNETDNTIICQNGRDECFLHKIQACAINVWNDVDKYYALIHCMEFLVIDGTHSDWQSCFNSLGLSEEPILECYNNGTGAKLQALYGYETAHLDPPHVFMPWVVVNNKSLGKDYGDFTTYICSAYEGKVKPNACKSST
ncbi:hypothetical protein Peur_034016 [Populus x canadensis]|uniref:gamma-interferon-responsive lysosomal thiol protein-like n=1 Tax=Populus nigra TaxID=3691 RepID=UPI002B26B8D7|nr:gamma-interferon-responsive lysosomal thiol protein-like [Populus nigra]